MPEIEFDPVDSIAAGAIGEPGHRAFYIQAEKDGQVLYVLVEKQQVAMLAERVQMLLDQVESEFPEPAAHLPPRSPPTPASCAATPSPSSGPSPSASASTPPASSSSSSSTSGRSATTRTTKTTRTTTSSDEPRRSLAGDDEEGYLARLYLTAAQARAMATRGSAAVESGRPPCPLCGGPLDPSGHVCPRLNGHGRHDDDVIQPAPGSAEERELLESGEIELLGRMPWSSNATFLVKLERDGVESLAIYKPRKGERPLWDFPRGTLCDREVAAHLVSEALGWEIVPLTILRDGPAGEGMVQRFVDHDPEEHFFTLREHFGDIVPPLRPLRRRHQQRRPQVGPLPPGPPGPRLGHRPRRLVPLRGEAPHRHLGLRGRADRPGRPRGAATARGAARRRPRPPAHDLLSAAERQAVEERLAWLLPSGSSPSR